MRGPSPVAYATGDRRSSLTVGDQDLPRLPTDVDGGAWVANALADSHINGLVTLSVRPQRAAKSKENGAY